MEKSKLRQYLYVYDMVCRGVSVRECVCVVCGVRQYKNINQNVNSTSLCNRTRSHTYNFLFYILTLFNTRKMCGQEKQYTGPPGYTAS